MTPEQRAHIERIALVWGNEATQDAVRAAIADANKLVKLEVLAAELVMLLNPNPNEVHNPHGISGVALKIKALLDKSARAV